MKKHFYLLLFLIPFTVNSQSYDPRSKKQVDSLNAFIKTAKTPDTSRVMALLALSEYYINSNTDTAITICENAMRLGEKIKDKKSLSESYGYLGYLHAQIKGDTKRGMPYFEKCLAMKEELGDKDAVSVTLNNIAYVYDEGGDVQKALVYYEKSLKMDEAAGKKDGIATALSNIGRVYVNLGDIKKALEYCHKSLKIREELNDKEDIAASLNNLGSIYSSQNDIKSALECFKKSLKINEELGNKSGIAVSLDNIGRKYEDVGDTANAVINYRKALKLNRELGFGPGIARSLQRIGLVYMYAEVYDSAEVYFKEAVKLGQDLGQKSYFVEAQYYLGHTYFEERKLTEALATGIENMALAKELGFPRHIRNAAKLLYYVYEKQEKGMQALEMYKLYRTMEDSLSNIATRNATTKQQVQYEYEKQKAIDDEKNNKLIAIEQQEKQKQQIITYATAVGLIIVAFFLIFVVNRLKVTRKQKAIIEDQKHLVEEKNKEITDSIQYAKRIQGALLPSNKMVKEFMRESFVLYKPKDIVAGDFYWLETNDGTVLFAAADCTGHGVPGALVSVVCINALNRSVREYGLRDPGEILNKTREIVISEFEKSDDVVKDGMDIALCSLEGNTLKYAGAHNPLWLIRNGDLIETKADKQPIGKFDNLTNYNSHTFELQKGDSLYLFSDGYVDQFGGENGKKFKSANLKKLLLSIQDQAMEKQRTSLNGAIENWKGNIEQVDDICVIGVRI